MALVRGASPAPYFGAQPITAISTTSVEDFIIAKPAPGGSVRKAGKGLADSSIRTGLLPLRLVLKRAAKRGLIPASPMGDVEWHGSVRTEDVDPFTGRELRAIIAATERLAPDFATLLRLWVQSGLRAGEVAGLQWQDLDLDAGIVKVRRTWSQERIGPPKTSASLRDASLLHPVIDDTPEWRPGATEASRRVVQGLRRLTVRSLEPGAFIFDRGGEPISSMEVHRNWKRVLLAASMRYRRPEQLRHTWASTMLSRNPPCSMSSSRAAGGRQWSCCGPMRAGFRNRPQPWRNQRPFRRRSAPPERGGNYLMTQNPCASIPSATLNLLRFFGVFSRRGRCRSRRCGSRQGAARPPPIRHQDGRGN